MEKMQQWQNVVCPSSGLEIMPSNKVKVKLTTPNCRDGGHLFASAKVTLTFYDTGHDHKFTRKRIQFCFYFEAAVQQ
jgi:hypothetical protein